MYPSVALLFLASFPFCIREVFQMVRNASSALSKISTATGTYNEKIYIYQV